MSAPLCSFYLDESLYGIPVGLVQEVLRGQVLTPVPLAGRGVQGILNLRGRIITVLDLRARLELPARPPDAPSMHILLDHGQETVGLIVDRIGDVIEVEEAEFEPLPKTLEGAPRELLRGAYKLSDRLLLALDVEKSIAAA